MAHRSPPAPLAHTFSIVARDAVSGQLGVAVQSHWFGVGAGVPWALAGVGAVATQAAIERSYGPRGLDLMREGDSAPEALARLLAADLGRDMRQVAMVDAAGRVAAHTGSLCVAFAGHVLGDGFSCQGNIMTGPEVWSAAPFTATTMGLGQVSMASYTATAGGTDCSRMHCIFLIHQVHPSTERSITGSSEDYGADVVTRQTSSKRRRAGSDCMASFLAFALVGLLRVATMTPSWPLSVRSGCCFIFDSSWKQRPFRTSGSNYL